MKINAGQNKFVKDLFYLAFGETKSRMCVWVFPLIFSSNIIITYSLKYIQHGAPESD